MATSGKIQPGDEVEAYDGNGGLVLMVDRYGQDVIVHHTGMYPKVWAARELTVVRRGVFDVRDLGAAEQNPVGWSVDEWNGLRWAYQARGWKAQSAPQEQAPLGDWKRVGAEWVRPVPFGSSGGAAYVTDREVRGVFRVLACGTLLAQRFTCPDAAREAADAYLVGQGRLDKSRAFVRLGEWEEDGVSYYRTKGGTPWHHAYMVAKKAEVDAELVASGALDPSRAFKAGPTLASIIADRVAQRMASEKHNSEPVYDWPREYLCKPLEPAKPAWGEWERRTIHGGKEPCKAFLRASSVADSDLLFAKATAWGHGSITHPATDIDDAREKADAFLVARGELEAGRAFKRVGDWTTSMPIGEGHDRLWEVQGVCVRMRGVEVAAGVARGLVTSGFYAHARGANRHGESATSQDAQQLADAELVRRGLLAEERAFKVAKPSAVYVQRIFLPGSTESFTVESNGARPFYVERAPDGQTRVTDWGGASCAVGPGDAVTYTITDGVGRFAKKAAGVSLAQWAVGPVPPTRTIAPGPEETVTLANWEHHLPALLSGAPREFRDGFNRRQGPAWEAYLVALAGVKERIQMNEIGAEARPGYVIAMATEKAHCVLGPEWVKANVREPLPKWEPAADTRMGHQ